MARSVADKYQLLTFESGELAARTRAAAFELGLLIETAGPCDEVIKLLPTLTIGDTEIKLFCDAFADVMDDASRGSGLMWDFGRTLIKQAIKR